MGVRGLTTYINCNQDVFMKKHYLRDTNVVIDGLSLCSQLYTSLNCFSAFGGDYDKYAAYVKTFFKNLTKCNIKSYVIFDGSYERRKLKTVFSRLRTRIKTASRLDAVTQSSIHIFPLLLRDVFKNVLSELNIAYLICEFEADEEIAALARHLNCPVLSYDSDFFIYNVLYVPFNTLDLKSKPVEIQGERKHVMECKLFKVENLTKHFGIQEDILPLLAILLGNDYIEKKVFHKFFSELKLKKSKKKKNDQQRSIHTLFNWVQNETLESAILKILGRLQKKNKNKVLNIIKKGIEGYNSKECQSIRHFNILMISNQEIDMKIQNFIKEQCKLIDTSWESSDESTDENEESDTLDTDDDNNDYCEDVILQDQIDVKTNLSNWFLTKLQQDLIPMTFLNLYTNHIHFCCPQADDYTEEDSFLCTLPILRYAFDILTDYNFDYCVYIKRKDAHNYKKIFVEREYATSRLLQTAFADLNTEELQLYFHHFLKQKMPNLDISLILLLPANFQLFMISMLWWIAHCNVPICYIHSLLVSYIALEVIDEKTGTVRGHFLFNNRNSVKLEEIRKSPKSIGASDDLFLNKNKVQYEDCLLAASVLLKHFEIDDSIRKKPKTYDTKKIHYFAQFQCCLQQMNALNILCRSPYERTVYHKCYNGTFIYNVALKMEKQNNPALFIEQYISGATSVIMFYRSLCSILNKIMDKMCLKPAALTPKRNKVKKKKDEICQLLSGLEIDAKI